MDYTLIATSVTYDSVTIDITDDGGTPGSYDVVISEGGTEIDRVTIVTDGSTTNTVAFNNLTDATTYTIDLFEQGGSSTSYATQITVTTLDSTPKTATQAQWEDLADRVNSRPIISSSIVPPISVEFVGTNNISNGAVTPAKIDMASLIDVLYPVGCYFETSDTTFDPNVSWGGTWVEDSAGKVTVSQDANDTDFDVVGETGGNKTGLTMIHLGKGIAGLQSGTASYNDRMLVSTVATSATSNYNEYVSALQPYVVIKRWHRTA